MFSYREAPGEVAGTLALFPMEVALFMRAYGWYKQLLFQTVPIVAAEPIMPCPSYRSVCIHSFASTKGLR